MASSSEMNVSPREKEKDNLPERPSSVNPIVTQSEYEFRQRVAQAYQKIGETKPKLKNWIRLHFVLVFFMALKQVPYVLDKADIFILFIEELEIPKPIIWEWLWLLTFFADFFGLSALRKNRVPPMKVFNYSQLLLGFGSVFYCVLYYLSDVNIFLFSDDYYERESIMYWRKYPLCMLNYIFIICACQVHAFGWYYSNELIKLWNVKRRTQ